MCITTGGRDVPDARRSTRTRTDSCRCTRPRCFATCYFDSTHLGVVADHWAGISIHGDIPGTPPLTATAVLLGTTVNHIRDLLHDVRIVGRLVHEKETGLPGPW